MLSEAGGRRRGSGSGTRGSALIENIEALLFAGVLALIIHQYVFQAFKIPTGSMAPTLLGQHKDLTCPNCGRWFPVNDRDEPIPYRDSQDVICSNCGYLFDRKSVSQATCDHFPAKPTHLFWRGYFRVLAGRFIYSFAEPQRWDIVVFKKPSDAPGPGEDYIKRIVGMPGETFDIRRGNIYSNGEIVRKPEHIQEKIWMPVYDSRLEKQQDGRFGPIWSAGSGDIDKKHNFLKLLPAENDAATASFRGSGDPNSVPVSTYLDYNYWDPPYFPIGEMRFDARFKADSAGSAAVIIEQDGRMFKCQVDIPSVNSEKGRISLIINGRPVKSADIDIEAGEWNRLTFTHVDATLRADIGGSRILEHDFDPNLNPPYISSGLFVEAEGTVLELEDITILRDNYYFLRELGLPQHTLWPFKVPDGHYMMLGDNSRHSSDSRYWGPVPFENIVGKAVIVWWPPSELRSLD